MLFTMADQMIAGADCIRLCGAYDTVGDGWFRRSEPRGPRDAGGESPGEVPAGLVPGGRPSGTPCHLPSGRKRPVPAESASAAQRQSDRLQPAVHLQLGQDVLHVVAHRGRRDE